MAAGQLRDRVSVQRKQEVSDGAGGTTFEWQNIAGLGSIRGAFLPERGNERLEAGRLESAVAGVLRLRSSQASRGITAEDRAVVNGVEYRIHATINTDRRGKYLDIQVERGQVT